jgi:hypothetical protein
MICVMQPPPRSKPNTYRRTAAERELATHVHRLLNLPANQLVIADDNSLHELPPETRNILAKSRGLLIVDDVVITGDRFWSYRNALERNQLTSAEQHIHFLVGVERTPNKETLQGVRDAAHGPNHFHSVDALILPNWGKVKDGLGETDSKNECPWCWELTQLKKFEEQLADCPRMRDRYNTLLRTDLGLSNNLFLHWGGDGLCPASLGPDSHVYGDLRRDVEVFTAVSSVVQYLRSERELSEQITPPAARILNPELTLIGRYYASVLTASILRSTHPHDLRSTASDVKLLRGVGRRLLTPRVTELRSELLIAMARGQIPMVDTAINDPTFFDDAEPGVRRFMHLLLSKDDLAAPADVHRGGPFSSFMSWLKRLL